MQEIYKWVIGIILLVLGIPIGNFLAKVTRDELKQGKKWFKLIIIICLVGDAICIFLKRYELLFTFSFIAIVTSRSIKR